MMKNYHEAVRRRNQKRVEAERAVEKSADSTLDAWSAVSYSCHYIERNVAKRDAKECDNLVRWLQTRTKSKYDCGNQVDFGAELAPIPVELVNEIQLTAWKKSTQTLLDAALTAFNTERRLCNLGGLARVSEKVHDVKNAVSDIVHGLHAAGQQYKAFELDMTDAGFAVGARGGGSKAIHAEGCR
ncbi:hypothetical protein ERJ75_001208100 [Trypanosoma vivax]|nr:hypothetical protein ERJ75_001208100 [Trypanosoma vivax]